MIEEEARNCQVKNHQTHGATVGHQWRWRGLTRRKTAPKRLPTSSVGGIRDEPARNLKLSRLVWTPQLYKRFVDGVAHLGIKNAVPKTMMQLMSVDALTREDVASHFQKVPTLPRVHAGPYLPRWQCRPSLPYVSMPLVLDKSLSMQKCRRMHMDRIRSNLKDLGFTLKDHYEGALRQHIWRSLNAVSSSIWRLAGEYDSSTGRGRQVPLEVRSWELGKPMKRCMNAGCDVVGAEGGGWRNGWLLRSGGYATLCEQCGLAYEQLVFCDKFHQKESGWRECSFCGKRLHCGCIASKSILELLDGGGVQCLSCLNSNGNSSIFFLSHLKGVSLYQLGVLLMKR
ncbi:hypothetical protein HPP92_013792 [Vanilla planifolia]|uniref:VAL1-3 N-terminal zinc finger domain-containing protein n=1 Tax=Vanilla planifolia TaxID=51239 RepID=A0A835UYZ2_VANPL|nr:hypothetical protein HPP92_013792 [Vanilla planifolia]